VDNKVMRYGEIKRSIKKVTHKVLSKQLKDLENDGIISRREYPEIPPKVEYSLTEKGISLIPLLQDMVDWGNNNLYDKQGL
jgi:DNA-binding HxlR family transcriptional regulator